MELATLISIGLVLLLCGGMHFFMMRGMHGGHSGHAAPETDRAAELEKEVEELRRQVVSPPDSEFAESTRETEPAALSGGREQ